jgi:hypothetical protein
MIASKCSYNEGSNFDREGQMCTAVYMGKMVHGEIISSRVKYGGMVQHTVKSMSAVRILNELRPKGTKFLVHENDLSICVVNQKS